MTTFYPALRDFRADPTDRRFGVLYAAARPWLSRAARAATARYAQLSLATDVADVENEGALALATAARRFVYLCDCGRAFVHLADFARHNRDAHGVRGAVPGVGLERFSRTSSILTMRRTANRLRNPDVVAEGVDPAIEVEADLDVLLESLRARLSGITRANFELYLRARLSSDPLEVRLIERIDVAGLRCEVRRILIGDNESSGGRAHA